MNGESLEQDADPGMTVLAIEMSESGIEAITPENTGEEVAEPAPTSTANHESSETRTTEDGDFRASGFALKKELAWWFPEIELDEQKSWRIWLSKRSRALLMNTTVVAVILLVNFVLTVVASSHYTSSNGVGIIYEGDCDVVKRLSLWLHLLINLLGTCMLAASNYCMQLQAAPTRENVNTAHRNGKWVDIGVPSLRNLWYISNWRRLSWVLLAVSSVPIHLIYNSAVFPSLGSSEYTVAVVNNAFLQGGKWDLAAAESRRKGSNGWAEPRVNPTYLNYLDMIENMQHTVQLYEESISQFDRNLSYSDSSIRSFVTMNVSACFEYYTDYWTAQGHVLIVVANASIQAQDNDSLLIYTSIVPRNDNWPKNLWAIENGSDAFTADQPPRPVKTWYVGPSVYEVDHCLVQTPASDTVQCRFEYSPQIMVTICVMNAIKTIVMICVWGLRKWQSGKQKDPQKVVLYTSGDAIASFMRDPDETTKDMCLATFTDFRSKRRLKNRLVKEDPTPPQQPREWKNIPRPWMSAASRGRWMTLILFCVLVLAVAVILIGISIKSFHYRNLDASIPGLWKLGFGALTPYTYTVLGLPRSDPAGLISNVLVANLPQFIVSMLYIFYNSMLSCFLVQLEFSRMHHIRKPLRVSEPEGIQRSSYFISLPLRYGIPLYITSGLIHWLISQSIFLARITAYSPNGLVDEQGSFSTCGYSPIALFITILVGTVLVLAIVIMGFRKYDGTMPLVSTNSRAISSACHVLDEDRHDAYLLPIQWGVLQIKDEVGHAAFTTAHVIRSVEDDRRYA